MKIIIPNRKLEKRVRRLARRRNVDAIAGETGLTPAQVRQVLQVRSAGNVQTVGVPAGAGKPFRLSSWLVSHGVQSGLLIIIVLVVYANSLDNDFVSDDITYLVRNTERLKDFRFVLDTPLTALKALINWLTYHTAGLNQVAFHGVNILFHTGSVLALYLFLSVVTGGMLPLLAAALFAVHPVITESVTWIGGGGYAMYGFFFLSALALYAVSHSRRIYYIFSVILYLLMLLTSEKSILLFLAFIFYEISFGDIRKNWRRLLPFVILSSVWVCLVLFVFRYAQQRLTSLETEYSVAGYYNPLVQIPTALSSYLELIIYPKYLSFFHSRLEFPLTVYLFRVAVVTGLTIVTAVSYMKNRFLFFFLMLYPISLLPFLSPFPIAWVVAERYVYLGSAAVITVLVWIILRLAAGGGLQRIIPLIAAVAVLVLGYRTVVRNNDWNNFSTLWTATAETAANDARVHNNLGNVYLDKGNLDDAEKEFLTAVRLKPGHAGAYYNLGLVYQKRSQPGKATEYFRKSIEADPDLPQPHKTLASMYFETGDYGKALEQVLTLSEIDPENSSVFSNLGLIYEKLEDSANARQAYRRSLQLDPDNFVAGKQLQALEDLPD
ncbi:hypothetical protein A2Z33_06570 [Candidatus Gottesmanbacteria bacterium RBG_16_52_11]|uniref:Uncharacterized protein n=1 Tax=Candidatus Gottesmanbacteria bacterium RBG_16_52_11 TaxID=1798374 RepID=A0A1F5YXM6_9BACT|nr:MAG: hypothetical protein A2Z33_06570 [Candidatus Gottesmanbacteria bacterium RBG_16_52_11]